MYHDFFSHFVFFPTQRCIANDRFCVRGQVKSFILGAEILKYFIQVAFVIPEVYGAVCKSLLFVTPEVCGAFRH